jgi:phytoene synthase
MDQVAIARKRLVGRMNSELVESYRHCQRQSREAASNFARMFWLLPADQRRAMQALYAFARQTDDLADGPRPLDEKRAAIQAWRQALERAFAGRAEQVALLPDNLHSARMILPAVADTAARFQIPRDHLRQVIVGVEMDLDHREFATFDELRHYCLHVASAVGLACLPIWGCRDERAEQPAIDCGIAFQLTNILRDLAEDAGRGRNYLPREDLERFGCQPLPVSTPLAPSEAWLELIRFECTRAVQYYDRSHDAQRFLAGSGRRMFRLMHATYRALLEKIVRAPHLVFERRQRVSRPHKAWIVLKTLLT